MRSEIEKQKRERGINMKKVWLVVTMVNGVPKFFLPKILGVYSTKEKAEKIAYTQKFWCKVIEKVVE